MIRGRAIQLSVLVALAALIAQTAAHADPTADAPAGPPTIEQNWADLAKGEPVASRALLRLAATPEVTVAFFKENLKPLTLSKDDLDAKMKDLASDDEKVWKPAFEYFEYFDPRLASDLPSVMLNMTDAAGRSRMAAVLSDLPAEAYAGQSVELHATGSDDAYNFRSSQGSSWAEYRVGRLNSNWYGSSKKQWTRAIRAIVLLQQINTPDALAIVADMATGHEDAMPTKVAKDPAYAGEPRPVQN